MCPADPPYCIWFYCSLTLAVGCIRLPPNVCLLLLLQGYERAWCLLRARAALDGAMAVNQAGLVPAWLRGRAGAGEVLQLPHVQLLHRPGQREEGEVLWQAVAAMSGGAFDMLLDMMV